MADLVSGGGYLRGNCSREGLGSPTSSPRSNATLNLPSLDPITTGDHKYTWLCESRKLLESSAEENAAHSKHSSPVATEELKRFKASLIESSNKARGRAKRLDESVENLNRYCEALYSKKQQKNEFLENERSCGSNLMKMGAMAARNTPDLLNKRLEDRTKAVVMNRRVRSSATEIRAEGRSKMLIRQPMDMAKDKGLIRGEGTDLVEEKICMLPAGGEAWDKKRKRKRSVGTIFSRPMDGDAELKKTLLHKTNDEPNTQASAAQSSRSGPFNGGNGINKLDCTSMSGNANARAMLKSELDKSSLSRDFMVVLNKERVVPNGNRLNVSGDNQLLSPISVTKLKASRAARSGPITECSASPSLPRICGTPEGWEQPPIGNKNQLLNGDTNHKRPMPTGSASSPMAPWGGQRPQKMSRTRRVNLVSPLRSHEELQTPSEGCSPSDVGSRLNSSGTNVLLLKSVASGTQQLKIKQEIASSPARLSEFEESSACGNRETRSKEVLGELDERVLSTVQNTAPMFSTKKNRMVNKEGTRVVQKQGKGGRGLSSASWEILETTTLGKPLKKMLKNMWPGSEKNGSKSGRPPLKKLSDRKAFFSLGQLSSNGSPDCPGESDDDPEELLAAANFACNARNLACSSHFWKKMDPIFGFSFQEASLKEQGGTKIFKVLKSVEENNGYLSKIFGNGSNVSSDAVQKEDFVSKTLVFGSKERILQNQIQEVDIFQARVDSERRKTVPPLYQRVLSALIMEDDTEEFAENINDRDGRTIYFQYDGKNSPVVTSAFTNVEFDNRADCQVSNSLELDTVIQCSADSFSCNRTTAYANATDICNQLFNDHVPRKNFGLLSGFSENGADDLLHVCTKFSENSSLVYPYEKMSLEDKLMLELQSVGQYQETVPDLEDGEEGALDQDIVGLQKQLHQQVDRKKMQLQKLITAVEEGIELEKRHLEQIAMDRLVELAYRKLLATRGSMASKFGISRVPRPVATAFMKRTLARCRTYDETGKNCFSDPALQDVMFATPPCGNNGDPTKCNAPSLPPENQNSMQELGVPGYSSLAQPDHGNKFGRIARFESLNHPSEKEFFKIGPMSNRGKKEVLLDHVGSCSSLKAASNISHTLPDRVKGKRSERERDKDVATKNSVSKGGRPSLGNNKSERKTKTKPKQKTARLSTSGNGLISNSSSATAFGEATGNSNTRIREFEPICNNNIPEGPEETMGKMDITNLQLNELDSIELGVANDFDGNQDLSTWLDIDDEGLQEHDVDGLDIPMDDLSGLMFL